MQVIGSKLLDDPVLQSTVKDQKLPWMTTGEARKNNNAKKNVGKKSNIPKKLLNMNIRKVEDKTPERYEDPHPIVAECIKHVTDEFWIDIMDKLSYGECPKDFALKGNNLSFKRSPTKIVNLSLITTDDYKELCYNIIGFISSCANIHSPMDIRNTQLLELHLDQVKQDSTKNATWKSIKSTNLQSIHLYNYARSLSDMYGLIIDETYSLLVFYVRLSGLVPPTSILFEDGVIVEIEGLCHDDESNTLYFDPSIYSASSKRYFVHIEDPTVDDDRGKSKHLSPTRKSLSPTSQPAHRDAPDIHSLVADEDDSDFKPQFTLNKQWKKTVSNMGKKSGGQGVKNSRSQVLQSLSLITSQDLEQLSNSITDI